MLGGRPHWGAGGKMKIKNFGLLAVVAFCFTILSCSNPSTPSEETYTVWTDVSTYSAFQSDFNTTLNDGMYVRLELTTSQWDQISSSLTSEGRHSWTKSQIKDWLLGRGFGDSESTKESAWFATIDHGFLASRTGNTVYYILK
ncbi:hypothetical protein SAMN04487775_1102 [Treponema bryantii]|uniref:Lipoprotein n=2 Tax=Treponema bryantii TaxID=163 RepID=A0A1I3MN27_9SPIR|nr:hypothetical protein SAMN04487775_1102 [Treponema bryantii]